MIKIKFKFNDTEVEYDAEWNVIVLEHWVILIDDVAMGQEIFPREQVESILTTENEACFDTQVDIGEHMKSFLGEVRLPLDEGKEGEA